jgi:hypothetical protein
LQAELATTLGLSVDEVAFTEPFAALVPPSERRRVWQELRQAGFALPELCLSQLLFWAAAVLVLIPAGLLVGFLSWAYAMSTIKFAYVVHKLTLPGAIYPPIGCETLQEAALHLTPFKMEDYRAGLWPDEAIAAKVRWILSCNLDVPFGSITDKTRLEDLGCF